MINRKKIRVAVIGVGYLGNFHAQKYAKIEGAELVGVTDADGRRANEVAAANGTKAFASHTELFGKVDAVSIVTPTESHYRIGMEFLQAGADVLIEKPIANSVQEAGELVRAAERAGRILQVGHLERFNGAMSALGDRVKGPSYIEAFRLSPFPNRSTDVDVVLDVMIHDIDLVLKLAGSEVEEVEAFGMPIVSDKDDLASARIRFTNGAVANITANRASKERVRRINVYQRDACIAIDYASQSVTVSRPTYDASTGLRPLVDDEIASEKKDALFEELSSFIESCSTRKTPVVSGVDGKKALEVAVMVQLAIKSGRTRQAR
ncbi:MAG: Gfo/Idh/MocA family oxidoreductase [Deltaproteobacteria bacterium]